MKVSEIQTAIFEQTGLKTSIKKNSGSMKEHYTIWPIFQNGSYPSFPAAWVRDFGKQFKPFGKAFPYCGTSQLDIPIPNITVYDPINYKKESKPKPLDDGKPMKGWGSKNSQMRLDKASVRNAKKLMKGTTARYS